MSEAYSLASRESISDPETFWGRAAKAVEWASPPSKAYDAAGGWFPDATLNTCHNCVDRHVAAGRGDATALIYDSPVTDTIRKFSYTELLDEVGRVAAMLAHLGVGKGDRVVIYMPMVPETMFAMLACARLGAVHSVVFGGFAPLELAKRIDDATPKLVLAASCGIEGARTIAYKPMVDEALKLAKHQPDHVILLQRDRQTGDIQAPRDIDWAALRADPLSLLPWRSRA